MWMKQILLIRPERSTGPGISTVEQGRMRTTISMSGLGIIPENAGRTFERNLASTIGQNPKAFWKYTWSKTQVKEGAVDLENGQGILTTSDKERTEVLNRFYSSVFTQDTSNIPALHRAYCKEELADLETTQQVEGKLNKLRIGKSPGPDGLHPSVSRSVLSIPSILYRHSLAEGALPSEWKAGQISPVFKKEREAFTRELPSCSSNSHCL